MTWDYFNIFYLKWPWNPIMKHTAEISFNYATFVSVLFRYGPSGFETDRYEFAKEVRIVNWYCRNHTIKQIRQLFQNFAGRPTPLLQLLGGLNQRSQKGSR